MNLLTVKILAMVLMGGLALFFGLIPLKVKSWILRGDPNSRKRRRGELVLSGLLCIGSGVLIATVFIHMIPETREGFELVKKLRLENSVEARGSISGRERKSHEHSSHFHSHDSHDHHESENLAGHEHHHPPEKGVPKVDMRLLDSNKTHHDHRGPGEDVKYHISHNHEESEHDHSHLHPHHDSNNETVDLGHGGKSSPSTEDEASKGVLLPPEHDQMTSFSNDKMGVRAFDKDLKNAVKNSGAHIDEAPNRRGRPESDHLHHGHDHEHGHGHEHVEHVRNLGETERPGVTEHDHDREHDHDHHHEVDHVDQSGDVNHDHSSDHNHGGRRGAHEHGKMIRLDNLKEEERRPLTNHSQDHDHDHNHDHDPIHDHDHDHNHDHDHIHDHNHDHDHNHPLHSDHQSDRNTTVDKVPVDRRKPDETDFGDDRNGARTDAHLPHTHHESPENVSSDTGAHPETELKDGKLSKPNTLKADGLEKTESDVKINPEENEVRNGKEGRIKMEPPQFEALVHHDHEEEHEDGNHSDHDHHHDHEHDHGHGYPMAELVVCLGFFLIYFLEETLHKLLLTHKNGADDGEGGKNGSHGHAHSHSHAHTHTPARANHDESGTHQKKLPEETYANGKVMSAHSDWISEGIDNPVFAGDVESNSWDRKTRNSYTPQNQVTPSTNEVERSHPTIPTSPPSLADQSPKEGRALLFILSNVRSLLVVVALSFHAVFEGMAVGLQEIQEDVWYLFLAISAHKFVIAFCVGLELLVAKTPLALFLMYMLVLALVTPFGIGIGIIVTENSTFGGSEHYLVITILQGIAGGTLLYVALLEVLERERSKEGNRLVKLFCLMLGFALMASLEAFGGHSHGPSQDAH